MLRNRLIFSLIYNDGYFTQSRNFRLQRVGDINWLNDTYNFSKIYHCIDELMIINASRNNELSSDRFLDYVKQLSNQVLIPICAGGRIRDKESAQSLFQNGADKIILNTVLSSSPELVKELVSIYGSQAIVASIDYRVENNRIRIYIENGQIIINSNIESYLEYVQSLGVGEIYFNSIDKDGTGFGYDFSSIEFIMEKVNCPLIIAGGAGNYSHFEEALQNKKISAIATANLYNFMGDGLGLSRQKLLKEGYNLSNWEIENE